MSERWTLLIFSRNASDVGGKEQSLRAQDGALPKIVSVYDQEIPQSQTTDNPKAPRGRASQPSRDTRETN